MLRLWIWFRRLFNPPYMTQVVCGEGWREIARSYQCPVTGAKYTTLKLSGRAGTWHDQRGKS